MENGRKPNQVRDMSFAFALDAVKTYKEIVREQREYVLSKQWLRSATSIGANVQEAEHAESRADFTHKHAIALKEANESRYWMELLYQSGYMSREAYSLLNDKNIQLIKLLAAIVKKSKLKSENSKEV
ncbi:MAG: four helix bundle protein [Flavobacteriales bacterium]|nr:four helix bundle protein [Flavobacteriales bacterium]MCB9448540.1 four helix bundle protein [Flavobacteriales bacterium]